MQTRLIKRGASLGCGLLLLALSACEQQDATREPTPVSPPEVYQIQPRATPTKELIIAHLGFLPGLIESADKGAFIELVKAIDEVYPEGQIEIRVYPLARAQTGVIKGTADINLPALRNPAMMRARCPTASARPPSARSPMWFTATAISPSARKCSLAIRLGNSHC